MDGNSGQFTTEQDEGVDFKGRPGFVGLNPSGAKRREAHAASANGNTQNSAFQDYVDWFNALGEDQKTSFGTFLGALQAAHGKALLPEETGLSTPYPVFHQRKFLFEKLEAVQQTQSGATFKMAGSNGHLDIGAQGVRFVTHIQNAKNNKIGFTYADAQVMALHAAQSGSWAKVKLTGTREQRHMIQLAIEDQNKFLPPEQRIKIQNPVRLAFSKPKDFKPFDEFIGAAKDTAPTAAPVAAPVQESGKAQERPVPLVLDKEEETQQVVAPAPDSLDPDLEAALRVDQEFRQRKAAFFAEIEDRLKENPDSATAKEHKLSGEHAIPFHSVYHQKMDVNGKPADVYYATQKNHKTGETKFDVVKVAEEGKTPMVHDELFMKNDETHHLHPENVYQSILDIARSNPDMELDQATPRALFDEFHGLYGQSDQWDKAREKQYTALAERLKGDLAATPAPAASKQEFSIQKATVDASYTIGGAFEHTTNGAPKPPPLVLQNPVVPGKENIAPEMNAAASGDDATAHMRRTLEAIRKKLKNPDGPAAPAV